MKQLALALILLSAPACKREPDATGAAPPAGSAAPAAHAAPAPGAAVGSGTMARARPDPSATGPTVRMPIAASKLELVGNSTIKALELSDNGEVRVGDKLYGTLGTDGTFTRDGKVLAALGEEGELLVGGQASDPPIRIDPDGDVFLDGELMLTIADDGKISSVDKDGTITENVLALLEGPPQGRRSIALLLVLMTMSTQKGGGAAAGPADTGGAGKTVMP